MYIHTQRQVWYPLKHRALNKKMSRGRTWNCRRGSLSAEGAMLLGGSGACSPGKIFKFDTIMKHSEGLCYSDWSLLHAWNLPLLAHSCRRFCLFDLSCIIRKWQVNDNLRHNIDINNDYSQVNPEGGRRCGLKKEECGGGKHSDRVPIMQIKLEAELIWKKLHNQRWKSE